MKASRLAEARDRRSCRSRARKGRRSRRSAARPGSAARQGIAKRGRERGPGDGLQSECGRIEKGVQWTALPPNTYGGLLPGGMRRPKALEDESEPMERQWSGRHWRTRPRKIVADLMLDRERASACAPSGRGSPRTDVIRRKLVRAEARTGGAQALTLAGCARWFAGCASIGACRSAGLVGPFASTPPRSTRSPAAPTRRPSSGGSRRLQRRGCGRAGRRPPPAAPRAGAGVLRAAGGRAW